MDKLKKIVLVVAFSSAFLLVMPNVKASSFVDNQTHKVMSIQNQSVLAYNNKNANVIITFRDKNLEKVIRDYINKPDGSIYKSDVEKVTELQAFDMGIQDISGIENLTNLQEIGLSGNKISDISVLKQLTNLKNLDLNENQIQDISALKDLTNLEKLDLGSNQISDISALSGLVNLRELYSYTNEIRDISPLKQLTNLQYIWLNDNKISNKDKQSLKSDLPKCNIIY